MGGASGPDWLCVPTDSPTTMVAANHVACSRSYHVSSRLLGCFAELAGWLLDSRCHRRCDGSVKYLGLDYPHTISKLEDTLELASG